MKNLLVITLFLPVFLFGQIKTYHLQFDSTKSFGDIHIPLALNEAPDSENFVIHDSIEKPTNKVSFKANWDKDAINFYISVLDTTLVIQQTQRDSKIFATDDCVEIFIDFDGDGKNYLELGVNPNKVYYDYKINCPKKVCGYWDNDPDWNLDSIFLQKSSFVTTTAEDEYIESGYALFISIPFSALNGFNNFGYSPPSKGTIWRVNVFNINQETKAFNAWSPSHSFGFHQPDYFGKFIFE